MGSSARALSHSERFDESSARMGSTARASPHFPGWALRANLNFSSWQDVVTFVDSVETSLARLFSEIPTGFATDVSDSVTAPTFPTSTVFSLNPTLDPSDLELFDCSFSPTRSDNLRFCGTGETFNGQIPTGGRENERSIACSHDCPNNRKSAGLSASCTGENTALRL